MSKNSKKTPQKKSIKQSKNLNLCHWWRNARNSIIYEQWYRYVSNNAMNIQLIKAKHEKNSKVVNNKFFFFFFLTDAYHWDRVRRVLSIHKYESRAVWVDSHSHTMFANYETGAKQKKQDNEWHDARCYTKTTHTWLIEIMQWAMFVTYLCPIEAHANSAENLSETNFYNDFFKKKKRWKEITVWHWSIVQNIVIQPQMF